MSTDNVRSDGPRLPNGRFNLGNKEALGNPNNRRMHELRKALLDAIGPEKIKAIGDKLCLLAEAGDVAAARLIFEYVLGRPPQPIELTGEDGRVTHLHGHEVGPAPAFEKIEGTEFTIPADLVLLAMGFTGPVESPLFSDLGVARGGGTVTTALRYQDSDRHTTPAECIVSNEEAVVSAPQDLRGRAAIPARDEAGRRSWLDICADTVWMSPPKEAAG